MKLVGTLLSVVVLLMAGCTKQPAVSSFDVADRAALPESLRQPRPNARAVTMEPAGTWYVTEPPQRLLAYQAIEAEMAITLGRGDDLVGMFDRGTLAVLHQRFYSQLPGFQLDLEAIEDLPFTERVDKELIYRLDPDVLLVDPRLPLSSWGWSADDIGEVAERSAPLFGNFIRYPREEGFGPPYRVYTLEESLAIHAQLFDRVDRYERFAAWRQQVISSIQAKLPPPEERPTVAVIAIGSQPEKGQFYLMHIEDGGCQTLQYRDLGTRQAYDPAERTLGNYGLCDYETLAAIDPEVIFVLWALSFTEGKADFRQRFVEPMEDHPVGRRLAAVQNDRVLPGGVGEQGAITHLFQLEMTAQQLYPEIFGPWMWDAQPATPLFDRQALAELLRGEAP